MIRKGPRNRGFHPLRAATHDKRPLHFLRLPKDRFAHPFVLVNPLAFHPLHREISP
jgi:hypothetical protein